MKKALIELKGISKNFAGVKALQDVDLTIYEGETRCLAGENGCGKSTLIKIIAGVYVPNGGTIVVDGKEYSKLTTQQAIDAGIQIIYQDFAIFPNLTVAENIAMTSEKYEKIQKNIQADAELEHLINNSVNHLTETFTSKLEEHGGENPLYWYSKDEIETFIKKNILGANSEYEEEIEQQLLRINEMVPNLVSAYFDFPTEWEENGLADLVRNLYKVSK